MLHLDTRYCAEPQYCRSGDFESIKTLAILQYHWTLQEFSDCGLHNGKYTKNQPIENCGLRASIQNM